MRCCTLTSGIGALSTVRAERAGRWTRIARDVAERRVLALPSDMRQRIERRLRGRADRPFLDVGGQDLKALAERFGELRGIGLRRIGLEEIALAAEDIVDAGEAVRHHGRGRDAVARRHAAEVERLLDMLGVTHVAADARGLLGAVGEQVAHLRGVESEQRAGGGAGAEHAADAVGAARGRGKRVRRRAPY